MIAPVIWQTCHLAKANHIALGTDRAKRTALMANSIYWLIHNVIFFYQIIVFAYLITRILIQFGVVNSYNQFVQFILRFGAALVEPVLEPIRRIVPSINGIDLSPFVLLLGLGFIDILAANLLLPLNI